MSKSIECAPRRKNTKSQQKSQ